MLVINRRRLGLRIRDAYFASHPLEVPSKGADIVYCFQAVSGLPDSADFHTSVVHLEQPLEVLRAALTTRCRSYIGHAAKKDRLQCVQLDQPTQIDLLRFVDFYDKFARAKRVQLAHRQRLECLLKSDALQVCLVYASNSHEPIVEHAHLVAGHRVRLLYSASQLDMQNSKTEGPMVGRANRLLHWDSIVHFKSLGYRLYDLGGMSNDGALQGIDRFKRQFGGSPVREFNHVRSGSAVGRTALQIAKVLRGSRVSGNPRKSP